MVSFKTIVNLDSVGVTTSQQFSVVGTGLGYLVVTWMLKSGTESCPNLRHSTIPTSVHVMLICSSSAYFVTTNKNTTITGASSGIGGATAQALHVNSCWRTSNHRRRKKRRYRFNRVSYTKYYRFYRDGLGKHNASKAV